MTERVVGVKVTILGQDEEATFEFDTGPGAPPMLLVRGAPTSPEDRGRVEARLDIYSMLPGVEDIEGLALALEHLAQDLREGAKEGEG